MEKLYIVTGANGHLGSAICTLLKERNENILGLVLAGEDVSYLKTLNINIIEGNVLDRDSLDRLFYNSKDFETIVIHTAAVVDILSEYSSLMESVNVDGTRNMIDAAKKYNVSKFVYVSSVHAIAELGKHRIITETTNFSPEAVEGAYAKTKAKAAAIMMREAASGFPVVIVHPSGIIGPYPARGNNLVQMIKSYCNGKLPAGVKGGYDFVDVRDCAAGCINAAAAGRIGQCYILSNRYYKIPEILDMLHSITGARRVQSVSLKTAGFFAPILTKIALRQNKKPLYTKYSLFTLQANGNFSHDKATRELSYSPREIYVSLEDTVKWLYSQGEIKKKIPTVKRSVRTQKRKVILNKH